MDGVPGDENLPLLDHITEFRSRLIVVVLALCVSAAIVYPFSGTIVRMIWNNLLPEGMQMTIYAPLELVITKLMLSFVVAFAVGIPLFMYELLTFAGTGLYPGEKRFLIKVVPTSFLLFLSGAAIAYFVIVPVIFAYIIPQSGDLAVAGLSLRKTFSLVTTLLLGFGLTFQLPVLVIAAIKMGLLELKKLKSLRPVVYGAFIALAMFAAPDATGAAQLITVAMLVILFEISLTAARFIKV